MHDSVPTLISDTHEKERGLVITITQHPKCSQSEAVSPYPVAVHPFIQIPIKNTFECLLNTQDRAVNKTEVILALLELSVAKKTDNAK